jgi:hypothetical protein
MKEKHKALQAACWQIYLSGLFLLRFRLPEALLILLICSGPWGYMNAQVPAPSVAADIAKPDTLTDTNQIIRFIPERYKLLDQSGPGLKERSGDVLLQLISRDDEGSYVLLLLHKENGRWRQIAENSMLLPSKDELGSAGSASALLEGSFLYVDCNIGSGSSYTQTSIRFERAGDGHYYFKDYSSRSFHNGQEDLTAGEKYQGIDDHQISFEAATPGNTSPPVAD